MAPRSASVRKSRICSAGFCSVKKLLYTPDSAALAPRRPSTWYCAEISRSIVTLSSVYPSGCGASGCGREGESLQGLRVFWRAVGVGRLPPGLSA